MQQEKVPAKRKIVVIVPGSKSKESKLPIVKPLLRWFYRYFGVQTEGDTWLPELQRSLERTGAEVVIFQWSGGISPSATTIASKELAKYLLRYSDREIILLTKSLGGVVARKAVQNTTLPVSTLIYIATPHFRFTKPVPATMREINIYSKADTYQQLANLVLYGGCGQSSLPGAENREIPHLRHSDFNHNSEVYLGGVKQRLFDFYRSLVA